jgi:hypothetical protein
VPTNKLAGGWRLGRWALYVAFYIMMTMIVPDEEDEEFANRRERNRCEYLTTGVCVSLGVFVVVYCDGMQNQEERGKEGPPEKRDCPEFELGKKDTRSSIEKSIQIIDLAY